MFALAKRGAGAKPLQEKNASANIAFCFLCILLYECFLCYFVSSLNSGSLKRNRCWYHFINLNFTIIG